MSFVHRATSGGHQR